MEIEKENGLSGSCSLRGLLQDQFWTFIVHTPPLPRVFHRSVAPCVPTSELAPRPSPQIKLFDSRKLLSIYGLSVIGLFQCYAL